MKNKRRIPKTKDELKHRWKVFSRWQRLPHRVKPLSTAEHDCPTCHTHYQGNFCPRCGQSAAVGRYSFKKAFLLFLDVWGMGNRGMYHTLRDLMLRPGYMVRDYLMGMQMAYFPPFKMLFLLTTLSIIVANGLNIRGLVKEDVKSESFTDLFGEDDENEKSASLKKSDAALKVDTVSMGDSVDSGKKNMVVKNVSPVQTEIKVKKGEGSSLIAPKFKKFTRNLWKLREKFPNIVSLLLLFLLSGFYYLFFRKMKTIENIRFSEFFIASVYFSNMMSILAIVFSFFCMGNSMLASLLPVVMQVVAFKQFSGFRLKKVVSRMLASVSLAVLTATLFVALYLFTLMGLSALMK